MSATTDECTIYPFKLRQNSSSGSSSIGDYEDVDSGSSSNAVTYTRKGISEKKSSVQASIWDAFQQVLEDVPENVLNSLPADAASEVDHYIYGTPKRKS